MNRQNPVAERSENQTPGHLRRTKLQRTVNSKTSVVRHRHKGRHHSLQVLQEMLTVKFKNWVKQCGSETVIHDLTQNCWPSSNYAQAYRRAWPRAWMRECTMLKRVFLQSEIHVTSTRNKSESHSAWPHRHHNPKSMSTTVATRHCVTTVLWSNVHNWTLKMLNILQYIQSVLKSRRVES